MWIRPNPHSLVLYTEGMIMTLPLGDVFFLGFAAGTLAMLLLVWAAAPAGSSLDMIGMTSVWAGVLWFCIMGASVYLIGTSDGDGLSAVSIMIAFLACVVHFLIFGACYGIDKLLSSNEDAPKNGTTPAST